MTDWPIPPPPTVPVQASAYASWISRVGAALLDGVIGLAVFLPFAVAGGVTIAVTAEAGTYDPATGLTSAGSVSPAGFLLLGVGYVLIFVFQVWNYVIRQGKTGQTLGKKAVGIIVISEATGLPPGALMCLARWFLQGILTPVTLYLNVLWPLWDTKSQTLHDKVLSTVVIKA